MWFGVITLFPEMFQALKSGVIGRAYSDGAFSIEFWNPRDFTIDKHRSVDEKPYGGGPGMVMLAEPLKAALEVAKKAAPIPPLTIYLSPQGKLFDQKKAVHLIDRKSVVFLSGRYEGIDERIIQKEVDEEWSIGDFILTGGEFAAMTMIDASVRLLPNVVGDENSITQDSLTSGLLKYPQYTRPENFAGLKVPEILLSGHHELIKKWRLKQSLGKTWLKRPDLLAKQNLTAEEQALLNEFMKDQLKNKF